MPQSHILGEKPGKAHLFGENVLVALGANRNSPDGPPNLTLRQSVKKLVQGGVSIRSVSRFFRTPAFPAGNGPDYVNAAISVAWDGTAEDLLALLHSVEAGFARRRDRRWGQRSLDLDLIAFGARIAPDRATQARWRALPLERQMQEAPDRLILPHPRLQDRAFVLVPLCDIAPGWRHPVLGRSIAEMCAALPQALRDEVKPL